MGTPVTRIINDEAEFRELRDPWNKLLKDSSADTVSLTWEWMYTWWEIFKGKKELFIILIEEGDRLIGIAPFYLSTSRFFGLRNLTHVEFLSSTGICSEYLDIIILKGREQEVITCVLDYLYQYKVNRWDVLNILSMLNESYNWKWIEHYLQSHNYSYWKYDSREYVFIELPDTIDYYLRTLDGKTRYNLRRRKARLMQDYSVTLTKVDLLDDLDSHFQAFLDLHRKRWSIKEGNESFTENRQGHLAFHKKIARLFCDNQWLYLVFLKANEEIIACQYNFVYSDILYNYSVAFDPDWGKYSPGSVLQLMVLGDIIGRKFREFDFLRGIHEYKLSWAKTTRKLTDVAIWRSSDTLRVVNLERKIRKSAKMLFPEGLGQKLYKRFFTGDV